MNLRLKLISSIESSYLVSWSAYLFTCITYTMLLMVLGSLLLAEACGCHILKKSIEVHTINLHVSCTSTLNLQYIYQTGSCTQLVNVHRKAWQQHVNNHAELFGWRQVLYLMCPQYSKEGLETVPAYRLLTCNAMLCSKGLVSW